MNALNFKLEWREIGSCPAKKIGIEEGPLVSVIVPCHNRPGHLGKTLEYLVRQSHRPLEIILVDDASEQDLLSTLNPILADFNGDWRMVRLEKNSGPGLARKLGHCLARGRYLQFLDSDDLISEEKIAVQSAFLEENPDLVMTYCLSHYLKDGNPAATSRVVGRTEREFQRILPEALKGIIWQTSSCLWRAKAVNSDNWKGLYWAEDILFDILTGLQDQPIAKTPGNDPLSFKRVDNTGLSHSLAVKKKAQLDILRSYDIIREILEAKGPALKDRGALMELIARRYLGKIMIFLTFRNHQAVIHCIQSVRAIRPGLLPLDARAAYLIYRAIGTQVGFSILRKWRWLGKKIRNFQGRLSGK